MQICFCLHSLLEIETYSASPYTFLGRVLIDPTPSPKNRFWVPSSSSLQKAPPILLPKCQSSASYLGRACVPKHLPLSRIRNGGRGGGGGVVFFFFSWDVFIFVHVHDTTVWCAVKYAAEKRFYSSFFECFFLLPEGSILQHQILPKSIPLIYTV